MDTQRWGVYTDPTNQHGNRQPSQCTVSGGVLTLTSLADRRTCGMAAKHEVQYGRWEARVRSEGSAWWHLFLIWPTSGAWPADGEMDWMEHPAGSACLLAFLHYPGHTPEVQEIAEETDCGAPTTEWHNVAFEWGPDALVGYVDGRQWFRFAANADLTQMPSGHLAVQSDDHGDAGGKDARMQVDWIRYYPLAA